VQGLATLLSRGRPARTWRVPVVRANFSDDDVWGRLKEEIISPTEEGFLAHVEFVEDRALVGLDEAAIVAGYPCANIHIDIGTQSCLS
jgi:hypothetical protein